LNDKSAKADCINWRGFVLDPDVIFFIAVWWIAASVAVMMAAGERGYRVGRWFFAGIFFGPIFAILLLIAQPPERRASDTHGHGWSLSPKPTEPKP